MKELKQMLRKQVMWVGKITTGNLGGYCLRVKIATQKATGYWECKYKTKYFVSENINKLRRIKKGQQYFGNYWGTLLSE